MIQTIRFIHNLAMKSQVMKCCHLNIDIFPRMTLNLVITNLSGCKESIPKFSVFENDDSHGATFRRIMLQNGRIFR